MCRLPPVLFNIQFYVHLFILWHDLVRTVKGVYQYHFQIKKDMFWKSHLSPAIVLILSVKCWIYNISVQSESMFWSNDQCDRQIKIRSFSSFCQQFYLILLKVLYEYKDQPKVALLVATCDYMHIQCQIRAILQYYIYINEVKFTTIKY